MAAKSDMKGTLSQLSFCLATANVLDHFSRLSSSAGSEQPPWLKHSPKTSQLQLEMCNLWTKMAMASVEYPDDQTGAIPVLATYACGLEKWIWEPIINLVADALKTIRDGGNNSSDILRNANRALICLEKVAKSPKACERLAGTFRTALRCERPLHDLVLGLLQCVLLSQDIFEVEGLFKSDEAACNLRSGLTISCLQVIEAYQYNQQALITWLKWKQADTTLVSLLISFAKPQKIWPVLTRMTHKGQLPQILYSLRILEMLAIIDEGARQLVGRDFLPRLAEWLACNTYQKLKTK
ncbi:hypothetical protein DM01DRAFT_309651 [Hesseltinella vesiculosa]|uniref:Uncharacterized protein n=1 Tax=Hesseltinella vesiculosa TaxID=101127 RepID=A0A1X2G2X5_9FUNG|nr:hypothetical protein DM01DRAFT_309651 [Hesseltinella vesiculosa]